LTARRRSPSRSRASVAPVQRPWSTSSGGSSATGAILWPATGQSEYHRQGSHERSRETICGRTLHPPHSSVRRASVSPDSAGRSINTDRFLHLECCARRRIDRSRQGNRCALRSDRPTHRTASLRASVSADDRRIGEPPCARRSARTHAFAVFVGAGQGANTTSRGCCPLRLPPSVLDDAIRLSNTGLGPS
jgi:hypothetical protein